MLGTNLPGKYADAEKNESTSFLPGDAESTKALEITKALQQGEQAPTVIVYSREGGLTAADEQTHPRRRREAERRQPDERYENASDFGNPAGGQTPFQRSEDGTTALIANALTGDRRGARTSSTRSTPTASSSPATRDGLQVAGRRAGRDLRRRDQGLRGHQRHAARSPRCRSSSSCSS